MHAHRPTGNTCIDPAQEFGSAIAMNDTPLLDIDLTASLWVLGVFAGSMLSLFVAERLAHTRARKRTRLAIEATGKHLSKNARNTTDSRATK
jgi:hypothetical protein